MALKANFTVKDIQNITNSFYNNALKTIFESLEDAAKQAVNLAKNNDTYTDQTGNLRASIGYVIFYNGHQVGTSFGRSTGIATQKSENVAEVVSKKYPKGFVVVLVAGMEYAAYVEAKNFDVLTGAALQYSDFVKLNLQVLKDVSGVDFNVVEL